MASLAPISKEYMSTLAQGWRFTLPAKLREVKGWDEGMQLMGIASGGMLFLSPADTAASMSPAQPEQLPWQTGTLRLGSGGKVIIPAALRPALQWHVGKRLVVTDEESSLSVVPCCGVKRCRSCGGVAGVREVIPNLYLCADCWEKYSRAVRQKPLQVKSRSW